MGAIERVCAGDAAAFGQYVAETGATICGHVPIELFLTMHAQHTRGELLTYYTSFDVTGDYEHCVSYASIAFPCPSSP
jgi:AmmeMemoRadiSam system protein B